MLKLAKIFILTIFVFCNFSYAATFKVEEGDDASAFEEVLMDAVNLSTEEANALKGYHRRLKDHHNTYVGPGDYTEIHLHRRPNGNVQSAIKFTHPEGGDFIYKLIIRTDKKSGDVTLHTRPKVFGSYKETIAFKEKGHQSGFVKDNQKILQKIYDEMMHSKTLSGENFKALSLKDLKKELKGVYIKISADQLHVKHNAIRDHPQYKEMQYSRSELVDSLRRGSSATRDDINNAYSTFRGKFNVFYGGDFKTWPTDFQDAHNTLKSAPSLSKRFPGKFKVKAKEKGLQLKNKNQSKQSNDKWKSDSQGQSSGSLSSGSKGQSSGSQGLSSGSKGQSLGSKGQSLGSQGLSSGSQGMSSGYQGLSSGSQGLSSGYQSSGSQSKKKDQGIFRKFCSGSSVFNSIFRKFCSGSYRSTNANNKSGWVSGDAEDSINDANDTLMNH